MDRIAVESSNLKSAGYDPESQVLEVEFSSGSVYQYTDVPASVYRELLDADSKGSYFNAHIRVAYSFTRVA